MLNPLAIRFILTLLMIKGYSAIADHVKNLGMLSLSMNSKKTLGS